MNRGFALNIILIGIVAMLGFGLLVALPFVGLLGIVGKKLNQGTIGGGAAFNHGGGYLVDEAFRDLESVTDSQKAFDLLKSNFSILPKQQQQYLADFQYIIRESLKAKVDPAILLGIWAGETGFETREKAMGCGPYQLRLQHTEEGTRTFEEQVTCALRAVNHAIDGTYVYTTPEGENIFTRLFYHYVAKEAKDNYDGKPPRPRPRPLFDEGNPRLIAYRALIPQYYRVGPSDEEYLAYGGTGPLFNAGETSLPFRKDDFIKGKYGNLLHWQSLSLCRAGDGHRPFMGTWGKRNSPPFEPPCRGEAVDFAIPAGRPVFAPFAGYAYKVIPRSRKTGQLMPDKEHIIIESTDRRKIAVLAHVLSGPGISAGSGRNATLVVAGQQVATIRSLKTGAHLHFELWDIAKGKAVTVANPNPNTKPKEIWLAQKRALRLPAGDP